VEFFDVLQTLVKIARAVVEILLGERCQAKQSSPFDLTYVFGHLIKKWYRHQS
jgi:hypothetical protein